MKGIINFKNYKGQALIETALVLLMLLIVLLGITEFSRAYFKKSSIKNAARSGARLAVVTTNLDTYLTSADLTGTACNTPPTNFTNCPNAGNPIINTACTTSGVGNTSLSSVCVTVKEENPVDATKVDPGDTVIVRVRYNEANFFVVGGGPWPWQRTLDISADASFRYE